MLACSGGGIGARAIGCPGLRGLPGEQRPGTVPSRAGLSPAELYRAVPGRAEPSRAEPSCTELCRAVLYWAEPC